jgi:PKHD-type hydroxylase
VPAELGTEAGKCTLAWRTMCDNPAQHAVNLTIIRKLLAPELLTQINGRLAKGNWVDGLLTAGPAAARVKRNLQLEPGPEAQELSDLVKKTLLANDKFPPLALPRRLTPILFSRYQDGMEYGPHTDDAVRSRDGIRTDLAATLFLSEPETYDGGELIVNNSAVKPAAGDLVLYAATTVHRVAPVTRGVRLAAVLWIQSLVRSQEQRDVLLSLHGAIARLGDHPVAVSVEAVQQNLLRMWAEP